MATAMNAVHESALNRIRIIRIYLALNCYISPMQFPSPWDLALSNSLIADNLQQIFVWEIK